MTLEQAIAEAQALDALGPDTPERRARAAELVAFFAEYVDAAPESDRARLAADLVCRVRSVLPVRAATDEAAAAD